MNPCLPNIGPRERRKRLKLGAVALAAAVILAVILPRTWRVVLFFPLWLAALGFFQARDKT